MFKFRTNIASRAQKTALVTGAGSSIGSAIAHSLAEAGYRLILSSYTPARLTAIKQQFARFSPYVIAADLHDASRIKTFTHRVKGLSVRIDVIINVAGIYHDSMKRFYNISYTDYSTQEILDIFGVGLLAPLLISHELLPLMNKGGQIVNISGTFENGAKGWVPYYVSKKALEDMTIGLSEELRDRGIRVNCISPGDTLTKSYAHFFPEYATTKNCLLPEDIAGIIKLLVSPESKYVTGQIIEIKKFPAD